MITGSPALCATACRHHARACVPAAVPVPPWLWLTFTDRTESGATSGNANCWSQETLTLPSQAPAVPPWRSGSSSGWGGRLHQGRMFGFTEPPTRTRPPPPSAAPRTLLAVGVVLGGAACQNAVEVGPCARMHTKQGPVVSVPTFWGWHTKPNRGRSWPLGQGSLSRTFAGWQARSGSHCGGGAGAGGRGRQVRGGLATSTSLAWCMSGVPRVPRAAAAGG